MNCKYAAVVLVVLSGLAGQSQATLVSENRLFNPPINDGFPKIEFENVNLMYRPDHRRGRNLGDGSIVAWGKRRSEYSLTAPGFDGVNFSGTFALHARIDRNGELVGGLGFLLGRSPKKA